MIKKILLAVLALHILFFAPWRLMALFGEVMVVSPGHLTHFNSGNDRYWQAKDLECLLEVRGWTVKYIDGLTEQTNAVGLADPSERSIVIDAATSWNERASVLAHEGGHTLQPRRLDEGQSEVFAESVAMLVAHDGLREHARYLANVRADVWVMVAYWREIYRAASELEN